MLARLFAISAFATFLTVFASIFAPPSAANANSATNESGECWLYQDDRGNVFYNDVSDKQCERIVSLMNKIKKIGTKKFENRSFENAKEINFRDYDIPEDIGGLINNGDHVDYLNKFFMVVQKGDYYFVSFNLHSMSVKYKGGAISLRADGNVTIESFSIEEIIAVLRNLLQKMQMQ
jgi:hypothetical protein